MVPESCPLTEISKWEIFEQSIAPENLTSLHEINTKTEFEVERCIIVHRKLNGDIRFCITVGLEGHDATSLQYTLSSDEAEKLGHMLLCDDHIAQCVVFKAERHDHIGRGRND